LLRCVKSATRDRTTALQHLTGRFLRVRPALALKLRRERLRQVVRQLNLLGPDQVLARGYSITLDAATGRILHQAHEVRPGQILRTKLSRGEVLSRVEMPPPAAGDADG
jgi:exonuclease VII large subunit